MCNGHLGDWQIEYKHMDVKDKWLSNIRNVPGLSSTNPTDLHGKTSVYSLHFSGEYYAPYDREKQNTKQ